MLIKFKNLRYQLFHDSQDYIFNLNNKERARKSRRNVYCKWEFSIFCIDTRVKMLAKI